MILKNLEDSEPYQRHNWFFCSSKRKIGKFLTRKISTKKSPNPDIFLKAGVRTVLILIFIHSKSAKKKLENFFPKKIEKYLFPRIMPSKDIFHIFSSDTKFEWRKKKYHTKIWKIQKIMGFRDFKSLKYRILFSKNFEDYPFFRCFHGLLFFGLFNSSTESYKK